ncbi:AraC family transcriptional regulator [Saccharopolyspora elongata]|uniref:AraC family transcriptional regulator n=1 Tax=Saccharopolyspora elongata TaxID=2530387 RepID=A0A4R4ZEN4_9PSEU|nr:AraC family transcriptional regulator [Saccharopolyspora elongata]TDD55994.1 AraC family transcriptional regulator [Saccharopolyspora elongata]
MDGVAELLAGARARGALFRRAIMNPPWSLRFDSGARLTLAAMLRGRAWIVPAEGEPVQIGPGDIAIIRGPAPHLVADDPGTRPQAVITSDYYCAPIGGEPVADTELGVRSCGVGPDGSALLLSGAYDDQSGMSARLLQALPDVLVIADADCPSPMLDLVAAEVAVDRPGQQLVLDRLLDLLLASALRGWSDQGRAPAWFRAMADPVTGRALALLHDDPAHPWTLADLAAKTGVSRAALGRRFSAEVGEPPMAYLAGWRTALAADLLRDTDATLGAIARKVGYGNAFALSVAFKRIRGTTPTEHRTASRDGRTVAAGSATT